MSRSRQHKPRHHHHHHHGFPRGGKARQQQQQMKHITKGPSVTDDKITEGLLQ